MNAQNTESQEFPFAFADVLALPDPEPKTAKRNFEAKGKTYTIELACIGEDADAQEFFDLASILEGSKKKKLESKVINLPQGKKVVIRSGNYMDSLNLLAKLSVSPKFSFNQWAIMGYKLGGVFMNSVLAFAVELNGLRAEDIQEEVEEAGNESDEEI